MSSEASKNNITALALFFVLPIAYYYYAQSRSKSATNNNTSNTRYDSLSLHFPSGTGTGGIGNVSGTSNIKIRPPFPPVIRNMLSSCRLAYLSTVQDNSSHLSLMRFTYINDEDDGEVIIMTTRRNTKKFHMLREQCGVALLIHDFSQFEQEQEQREGEGEGGKQLRGVHSITLNGTCRILDDDDDDEEDDDESGNDRGKKSKAKMYRAKHLKHNPDYPQFIVGPDISVLMITITSARICNINDQVTKWEAKDN